MDRLQRWSLVAEIIAAATVVVTLGILVLEVRDNTSALRAQTYQALTSDLNGWRRLFTEPAFLSEYMRVQGKRQSEGLLSLTAEERVVVFSPITIRWAIYESAFFANERGVLGDQEWDRFAQAACRAYASDFDFWSGEIPSQNLRELQTPAFAEFVEANCA